MMGIQMRVALLLLLLVAVSRAVDGALDDDSDALAAAYGEGFGTRLPSSSPSPFRRSRLLAPSPSSILPPRKRPGRPSSATTTTSSTTGKPSDKDPNGASDDDTKSLAMEVESATGKYALIHQFLGSEARRRPPGLLSYHPNPETPLDTGLGRLRPEEVWLSEGHLLVLRGGSMPASYRPEAPEAPIDDFQGPSRPVRIPTDPKVPPPFPVQVNGSGPLVFLGRPPPWFPPPRPQQQGPNGTPPLGPRPPFPPPFLPPPPNGTFPSLEDILPPSKDNLTDDPSVFYPPPYDFSYPLDNSTQVPAGPLAPGLILPPPPDFFEVLNGTRKFPLPPPPSEDDDVGSYYYYDDYGDSSTEEDSEEDPGNSIATTTAIPATTTTTTPPPPTQTPHPVAFFGGYKHRGGFQGDILVNFRPPLPTVHPDSETIPLTPTTDRTTLYYVPRAVATPTITPALYYLEEGTPGHHHHDSLHKYYLLPKAPATTRTTTTTYYVTARPTHHRDYYQQTLPRTVATAPTHQLYYVPATETYEPTTSAYYVGEDHHQEETGVFSTPPSLETPAPRAGPIRSEHGSSGDSSVAHVSVYRSGPGGYSFKFNLRRRRRRR